jgi:hypothetical protein
MLSERFSDMENIFVDEVSLGSLTSEDKEAIGQGRASFPHAPTRRTVTLLCSTILTEQNSCRTEN